MGLGLERSGGAADRREVTERDGVIMDAARDGRRLPFTIWSPDGPGHHPLILYSHASYGSPRQSSFLCAHLAAHGYVVAAVDHTGNTAAEWAARNERVAARRPFTKDETDAYVRRIIADRVPDLQILLDRMLEDELVDPERVGLVGWSFGGWAVLAVPEVDDRIRSIVALAPAGGSKPLPGIIPAMLTFRWRREIATLLLAAERDRFIPAESVAELYERAPSPKAMFVLNGADHGHFSDAVGDESGCSREAAHAFTRSHALAHFDATLRG